jgi:hypothetical protein
MLMLDVESSFIAAPGVDRRHPGWGHFAVAVSGSVTQGGKDFFRPKGPRPDREQKTNLKEIPMPQVPLAHPIGWLLELLKR